MNANTLRKTSIIALTAVGLAVAYKTVPSKRRAVYWGITDQLDEMNTAVGDHLDQVHGAVEIGEILRDRRMGHEALSAKDKALEKRHRWELKDTKWVEEGRQ